MKCPECKKEIKKVAVISECWQSAIVNKAGHIEDYGEIEEIFETKSIHCPNCDHDLTKIIMEGN